MSQNFYQFQADFSIFEFSPANLILILFLGLVGLSKFTIRRKDFQKLEIHVTLILKEISSPFSQAHWHLSDDL